MSSPRSHALHPNIARVTGAAAEAGLQVVVRRFPEGTRTAADAARAVGCEVGQIVKSLVFMADGRPLVALVSGADRVDLQRLAVASGSTAVRRANGDEARAATGFAIGGIPPIGLPDDVPVVMDRRLLAHATVWAAAGLPDAVFEVDPAELARASSARTAAVAEDPVPPPS